MRILFLTSEYPPYVWGGLGRYSREAVSALRQLATVDVLNVGSYYGRIVAARERPPDFSVVEEGGSPVVHIFAPEISNLFMERPMDLAGASRAACQVALPAALGVLNPPYDFIYAQDYYTAPFAVRLILDGVGRRLACMSHLPLYAGFTYFDKPHADDVHQALEALSLRFADVVVVPSAFAKRVLAMVHAVDPERIVVVGEGVHMDGKRGNGTAPAEMTPRPFRILTVARLVEQKGLHFTAQVLRTLSQRGLLFEFRMVGRGPLESRFRHLLDRDGLLARATLTRRIEDTELLELYASTDVFLSTSLYETFGLTVLEAMSRGCVPIAFRIPALRELIHDAGLTVPVGDSTAAANAIEMVASRPAQRASLSARAIRRAADFSWERHASSLLRIMESRA
jgi:glycosyltransferase involved in cell wall biosynthesis